MQFLNLKQSLVERGFLKGFIELPKDRAHWAITLLLILFAYALSVWVRLEWIDFAQANYQDSNGSIQYLRPDMVKNGVALPNTHDSFYFGSILQKGHLGLHENNHLIPSVYKNGMITYLPYILLKFSLLSILNFYYYGCPYLFPELFVFQLSLLVDYMVARFGVFLQPAWRE